MTDKARAPLGFGPELDDLDPDAWSKPKTRNKPKPGDINKAAQAAGFETRERPQAQALEPVPKQRRRRTGRNTQFNIKTKPETIEAFCTIADAQGFGLGEAFEVATKLLADRYRQKRS